MDNDYLFYQGRIREAQRLRNEALGQILADGWHGAKRLAVRIGRAAASLLLGVRYPQPH
ncbi:hypothetical protein LLG90_18775 [Aromatoleum toluclasticum]|uniref:hypothetical protein n=1 Tax=Aromatoleum toluclasticum TaxID=92003 RepID=UPI001D18EDA6|nr:hypothetical protein [Aromatoleum toluclasticum]MCC4117403.1 hypothetical protein [Aromatoleum toluclasticum]